MILPAIAGRSIEELSDAQLEKLVASSSRERLERYVVILAKIFRGIEKVAIVELQGGRMDGMRVALPWPPLKTLRARLRDGIVNAGWLTIDATPLSILVFEDAVLADYELENIEGAEEPREPRPFRARLIQEVSR